MFEQCINRLLSGAVLCQVTAPDLAGWLIEPSHLAEANAFLARIGRKVEMPLGGIFYLAYGPGVALPRAQVTRLQRDLLGDLRPMLQFIRLILDANKTDIPLAMEDILEVNTLLAVIDGNDALRQELREIAARIGGRHDSTDRGIFTAVIRHLSTAGYLHLVNADREVYQVTGKVQVLYDMSDFLMENMPGAPEAMAEAEAQGQLL